MKITHVREGIILILFILLLFVVYKGFIEPMYMDMFDESYVEDESYVVSEPPREESSQTESFKDLMMKDWAQIDLRFDYNTEERNWSGGGYQLRKFSDHCELYYYTANADEDLTCNFTVETYEKVLDLVLASDPQKYQQRSDENGKITYEIIPCALYLYWEGDTRGHMLCETPANIDEIIAKFEELKQAAE